MAYAALPCRYILEKQEPHGGKEDPRPWRETPQGEKLARYYTLPDGTRLSNERLLDGFSPGDVFWSEVHAPGPHPYCPWDNCDGRHLVAILPNGGWWNIDGRCNNCTLLDDRQHRCWTRRGDPAQGQLDVSKGDGPTCAAGGGSILSREGSEEEYHGHLLGFAFTAG